MKQTAIMSPIAAILLLVCLLVSIAALSGCSKEPGKSEHSDGTAAQESVDGKAESGSSDTGESEDTTEPQQETASPAEEENPFLTIMSTGKAELLNVEYMPYKDAMINGFGAYSEDYEEATIMTIGFAFESGRAVDYFGAVNVYPDNETEEKPTQSYYGTGWNNAAGDYIMVVVRVGGRIDPAKAVITLKNKYGREGTVKMSLYHNGEVVGFDDAITAFSKTQTGEGDFGEKYGITTRIAKLNGRYYIVVRRYCSVTRSTGDTRSYILIPLNGGLQRDMDLASKAKLHTDGTVTDVEGELLVNVNRGVDATTIDEQTTIELDQNYIMPKDIDPNDLDQYYGYIDSNLDYINGQLDAFAKSASVEIEDGDGSTVVLKFG
ncbi:MAG: hypothetical protein II038_14660 [Lachnospiraceae bacterium]|nr:hypothetical protein [Lachnospiraceae bacterium]